LSYPTNIRIVLVPCTGKVDILHILRAFEKGDAIGIGGERVQMYNLSSGEGPKFAEYAVEMDNRIRELGPNPIKSARKKAA